LSEEIVQNERLQIYLDILRDLEKEGKERMAYEVISRIIAEMPPELKVETLFGTLNRLPAEQLQKILAGLPKEQLQKALEVNSDGKTSANKKET
jgi:hypothetical protein